jgi:hypothetical protein
MGEQARRERGFLIDGVREYPWNSHDGREWREIERDLRARARAERVVVPSKDTSNREQSREYARKHRWRV